MVGGNVDQIHRRDLYSAARPSRRNCLINIWCGSRVCQRQRRLLWESLRQSWLLPPFSSFFKYLYVGIQVSHTLRMHSTLQSHGLFALAKHLLFLHLTSFIMASLLFRLRATWRWSIVSIIMFYSNANTFTFCAFLIIRFVGIVRKMLQYLSILS